MGLMTSSQAISKHAKGGRVNTPATKSIKRFTAFNVDIALSLPTTTDHVQRTIRENGVFYEQQMLAELSALLPVSPLHRGCGGRYWQLQPVFRPYRRRAHPLF